MGSKAYRSAFVDLGVDIKARILSILWLRTMDMVRPAEGHDVHYMYGANSGQQSRFCGRFRHVPVAEREPHSAWLYRHYDRGEYNLTDEHVRTARHAYDGNISYVDDLIGQVLDTLERIGQQDNTIVIFCSDHGEMLGERGQWYKMSPYEQSSRMPLIIKFPNVHAGKRVRGKVSLMDVAPTIMDMTSDGEALALSNQVDVMQGNSMRSLLEGGISDQPRRNFIQKTHYGGKIVSWDYQPFRDASSQYYRSHMTWLETEKQSMFRGG